MDVATAVGVVDVVAVAEVGSADTDALSLQHPRELTGHKSTPTINPLATGDGKRGIYLPPSRLPPRLPSRFGGFIPRQEHAQLL